MFNAIKFWFNDAQLWIKATHPLCSGRPVSWVGGGGRIEKGEGKKKENMTEKGKIRRDQKRPMKSKSEKIKAEKLCGE